MRRSAYAPGGAADNKEKNTVFQRFARANPSYADHLHKQEVAFHEHMRKDIALKRNWTGPPPGTEATHRDVYNTLVANPRIEAIPVVE